MRSVCAVSLLGNCGLMVPAASARIPAQDSYFLRAASFDSPADGLSAFAVEMLDIATMLRDASPSTLVLVDELGRGTETRAGAAIAGAVLEELVLRRCRGIFTTHLHEMFDLPLELGDLPYLRMEISMRGDGLSWVPTWRLAPGRCIDSLAVHAASQCGLPTSTISRARALASIGPPRAFVKHPSPLLPAKAAGNSPKRQIEDVADAVSDGRAVEGSAGVGCSGLIEVIDGGAHAVVHDADSTPDGFR
jgi:DNA mismatch repair ATPase MutS